MQSEEEGCANTVDGYSPEMACAGGWFVVSSGLAGSQNSDDGFSNAITPPELADPTGAHRAPCGWPSTSSNDPRDGIWMQWRRGCPPGSLSLISLSTLGDTASSTRRNIGVRCSEVMYRHGKTGTGRNCRRSYCGGYGDGRRKTRRSPMNSSRRNS
jgi:hypothetical protein